jgi:hypothetical protein
VAERSTVSLSQNFNEENQNEGQRISDSISDWKEINHHPRTDEGYKHLQSSLSNERILQIANTNISSIELQQK